MVDIAPESHIPLGSSPARETTGRNLRADTTINNIHRRAAEVANGRHAGIASETTLASVKQENAKGEENLTELQKKAKEATANLAAATARLAETPLLNPVEKVRTDLHESTQRVERQEDKIISQTSIPLPELKLPASMFTGIPEVTRDTLLGQSEIGSASTQGSLIGRVENPTPPSNAIQDPENLHLTDAEMARGFSVGPSLTVRETQNVQPPYVAKSQEGQLYNHLPESEIANGFIGPSMITVEKPQGFFSKISAGLRNLWSKRK